MNTEIYKRNKYIKPKGSNDWSKLTLTPIETYSLKISVIISTYNKKRYLQKILEALKIQTYPKRLFEVIVADDGSSDGTTEYIDKVRNNFNFKLRYVWQEDLGCRVAKSRNNGIKMATGDILLFFDGDTVPKFDCLERHAIWHHNYENIVILGCIATHVVLFRKIPLFRRRDRKHKIKMYKKTNYLKHAEQPWVCVAAAHFSCKKHHAYEIGLFSEEFEGWGVEDTEFGWRLYQHGLFIIPDESIVAKHLFHPIVRHKEIARQKNVKLCQNLMANYKKN